MNYLHPRFERLGALRAGEPLVGVHLNLISTRSDYLLLLDGLLSQSHSSEVGTPF